MRQFRICFKSFLLVTILFFTGCGPKHYDINRAPLITNFEGNGKILVATKDNRPFVVNGEKLPNYFGRQFDGFGVPKPIFTRSGRTVAEDISERVATSLRDNGFDVETVRLIHKGDLDLSNEKFAEKDFDRAILIFIDLLRAETFQEVELQWALRCSVYDKDWNRIAHKGNYGIDPSMLRNYTGHVSGSQGQRVIVGKIGVILQELLSSAEIAYAIERGSAEKIVSSNNRGKGSGGIGSVRKCEDVMILEDYLENDQNDSFRNYAVEIVRKKVKKLDCLDQIATIIWNEKDSEDGNVVDGLCHLSKIFYRNKHPRYKKFFKRLVTDGGTAKLRRYANKTAYYIPAADIPQFDPSEQDFDQGVASGDKEPAGNPDSLIPGNRMTQYLFSSSQIKAMHTVGRFWNDKLKIGQECEDDMKIIPKNYIPVTSVEFSDDYEHPKTGEWIQRFVMEKCGVRKTYNVLFHARPGNEPQYKAYIPGNTYTSLTLMNDAYLNATIMGLLKLKEKDKTFSCSDLEIIDTKISEVPHDVVENGKTIKGVWKEEWTIQGCGRTTGVAGFFVPDGEGGVHFEFK